MGCKSAPNSPPPSTDKTTKGATLHPPTRAKCVFPGGLVFTDDEQLDEFRHTNCTSIEGDLTIRGPKVTRITPLLELTDLRGTLRIVDTEKLENTDGLQNLERIDGSLIVERNQRLVELSWLDQLEELQGNLVIQSNPALESLPKLKTYEAPIGGDLRITDNPSLASLTGLEAIWRVEGDVVLRGLPVPSVEPIIPLIQIDGSVTLSDLPNVRGIDLTFGTIGGDLVLSGEMGFLPDCVIEHWRKANAQTIVKGTVFVDARNSTFVIDDSADMQHIRDFSCERTRGSIYVVGVDTTDLSTLGSLRQIEGDLVIRSNTHLESLAGLENLEAVGGDLHITHNPNLFSARQLNKLTRVEGELRFEKLPKLAAITGHAQLETVGRGLVIAENDSLTHLQAFRSLETVRGDLRIDSNWRLESIAQLDPKTITGDLRISHNPVLGSLGSLGRQTKVLGRVSIYPHTNLPEEQTQRFAKERSEAE
ncbi:receptor L domain-containing protein [Persicimonas caeni]|uniref:hypothetical protein n=1 Tax=Persicimonas caeni TaxID=2292766 RepID=UPI00143DDC47|nr:hypothetical protein [Persicimonas caeni]